MAESETDTITPVVQEPKRTGSVEAGKEAQTVYPGDHGGDGFLSGGGVPQRNFVLLSLGKCSL